MANNDHNKAPELHETAAKSHRAVAEQHGKGDHAKGMEHSRVRSNTHRVQINRATKPMRKANSKSN
jgi:hypothetical protein